MASKNFNFGDSSTTVNVTATGNIVGANIKSKGDASTPIYFDANGVAQPCTSASGSTSAFTTVSANGTATIDIPITITDATALTVYQNGILLTPNTNYTATTSAITLVGYTADAGDVFTFVSAISGAATINQTASNISISDADGYYPSDTSVNDALRTIGSKLSGLNATGLLKGDGDGSIVSAVAGTDYMVPSDLSNYATVTSINEKQDKITASGLLKGDGDGSITSATAGTDYVSPSTLSNYATTTSVNGKQSKITASGLLKGDGSGSITSATAGTDYLAPSALTSVSATANAALPKSGGTMTGVLTAQNNTSYTTKQVRNIFLSTSAPTSSDGANGDIWIKYVN